MEEKPFFSQFLGTEENELLKEEFEREDEEVHTMLQTILECCDIEKMRREVKGKMIRISIF